MTRPKISIGAWRSIWRLALLMGLVVEAGTLRAHAQYDPLVLPDQISPEVIDLSANDRARSRDIPLRIYLPNDKNPAPVVLFSHGLGGSRMNCSYLGQHWSQRGYVCVFLQHPGSDESVWKDLPVSERMAAMQKAANLENFRLRVRDVVSVLDQLERWNHSADHALRKRMDLSRIGMSGHSFGARTTQAVSGQRVPGGNANFTDERIKAALVFSPSGPRKGVDPREAFGQVKIPWMLMTGTNDVSPIGDTDLASRLSVFPALPSGGKYELVLEGAEHSAFTDRMLFGGQGQRNPNHHRVILALSTAFWDAYLRGDPAAREWLDGDGPSKVLEKKDRWQKK